MRLNRQQGLAVVAVALLVTLTLLSGGVDAASKKNTDASTAGKSSSFPWFKALLALVAGLVIYKWLATKASTKRRLSVTSTLMAHGVFPPEFSVPHPIIQGYMEFDTLPDQATLETMVNYFLTFERFRCLVVVQPDGSGELHEPSQPMTADSFITRTAVSSLSDAHQYLEGLLHESLPFNRPLWQMHVVENSGGRSLVIIRLHHLVGDGLSLLNVLLGAVCEKDGTVPVLPNFGKMDAASSDKKAPSGLTKAADSSAATPAPASAKPKRSPVEYALTMLRKTVKAFLKVAGMPVGPHDTKTPFTFPSPYSYSKRRKVVFMPDIPLEEIKALRKAANATVNDIVTALMAGAIRRYLEEMKDPSVRTLFQSIMCSLGAL